MIVNAMYNSWITVCIEFACVDHDIYLINQLNWCNSHSAALESVAT